MIRVYQDRYTFERLNESVNIKIYSSSNNYEIIKLAGTAEVDISINGSFTKLTSTKYGYAVYEIMEDIQDSYFNYIAIKNGVTITDIVGNTIPLPTNKPNAVSGMLQDEDNYKYLPYISNYNNTYLIRINDKWYRFNSTTIDSSKYSILTTSTSHPSSERLYIQVDRPTTNQIDKTIYLFNNTENISTTIDKPTIPTGYTLTKLVGLDELSDNSYITIFGNNITFSNLDNIGIYKYEIVATKNNVEYKTGTYTIIVVSVNIDEKDIEVVKGEEYKLSNIKVTSGDDICYPLTVTNSKSNANLTLTELNGSNVYSLTIVGTAVDTSTITLKCGNLDITSINLNIIDSTRLPTLPNKIELQSTESYTIKDVFYYNNFRYNVLDITTDIDSLFSLDIRVNDITESTPDTDYNVGRYVIDITAKANVSGTSYLYIKSKDGIVDVTIPVIITRVTVAGNIENSDNITTGDTISIYKDESYTLQYLYDPNANDMAIETSSNIITIDTMTINSNPFTYSVVDDNGNSSTKTAFFANNSTYKALKITGIGIGTATITVKTYINNSTTLVNTLVFYVSVLEEGTTKDDNCLVNIYPSTKTSVNSNIMLELPTQSCTLRLREEQEIKNAMINSNGYFYDYIEDSDPTKTSNPVAYVSSINPTWVNKTTMEVFTCIDTTTNDNVWIGSFGNKVNYKVLPQPGERGFGCGVAPDDILEKYNLSPMDGTTNNQSDKYGHYVDKDNKEFVFVPLHYIKPKFTTKQDYPYFNQDFDFSYDEDINNGFDNNCIPRCFWNNGKVQDGIFVAVDNDDVITKTISPSDSYIKLINYKEYDKDGYHNMSIFIQSMLLNLSKLQLIKTYENSNSNTDGRLMFKSETLTLNSGDESMIRVKNGVIDKKISKTGTELGINNDVLLTHNGQKCGIYNINGGYNSLLLGIYIHSETDGNGITTLHTHILNKNVEISEFDRNIAACINTTNSLTFKDELITLLFSNSNYSLSSSIPLNMLPSVFFISSNRPNYLNPITNYHTLDDSMGYEGFNTGIDFYYLRYLYSNNKSMVNYTTNVTDDGIISLGDNKRYNDYTDSYRLCVSNIIPSGVEINRLGIDITTNIVNHPNTRVARAIFDMRSIYPTDTTHTIRYSSRCCITPNMS
jgi:hypothetical protein